MAETVTNVAYKVLAVFFESEKATALAAAFAKIVTSDLAVSLYLIAIESAYSRANAPDFNQDVDLRRASLLRSAVEPKAFLFGKVAHGGVLTYTNTSGASNRDLWITVTHAGHEVNDIIDLWLDDVKIEAADISWGSAVTGGDFYNGTGYVTLYRNLGTNSQTAVTAYVDTFADLDSNHVGLNHAYVILKMTLVEASQKMFEGFPPRNVRAVMETSIVYDPRLDSSPGADPTNAAYAAYSNNPILNIAHYMRSARLGMGISDVKFDWDDIEDEAAFCDLLVPSSTPGALDVRFTSNGAVLTSEEHSTNILQMLSCVNGRVTRKNGLYQIKVGRYGSGPNLIANGHFDSDITGWANGDAARGTSTHMNASLQITNTGGGGFARAVDAITTVVGYVYTVKCDIGNISTAANYLIGASNNSNGDSPYASTSKTTENSVLEFEFTATATTTYITVMCNTAVTSDNFFADNIEMYLVSTIEIDGDWLRGNLTMRTGTPRRERFNSGYAFYNSTAEDYKEIQSFEVSSATFVSRDDGETIFEPFKLPFTDNEDEAQRVVFKRIQQTDEQKVITMPCNYKALDVAIHDKLMVTLPEWSFSKKMFRVIAWKLNGNDGGVDLTLREDSVDAYKDLDQADYTTRTTSGPIVKATPSVPDPTSVVLAARTDLPHMFISWVPPEPYSYWDNAEVWRHTANVFGSATKIFIGRTDGYIDTNVSSGTTYYYWVRMIKGDEVSSEVATAPTNSVAATITAADTTLVDGTAAATVKSGAALGTTSNQDSTATILGGNLTGTVDSTAAATVKSGAADGAGVVAGTTNVHNSSVQETGVTQHEGAINSLNTTNGPAEANADVTGSNTSADTTLVNGIASAVVSGGAADGAAVVAGTGTIGGGTTVGGTSLTDIESGATKATDAIFAPTGLTAQWVYDGTNQSPASTTIDVDVVFTDIEGASAGGTTTVRFTYNGGIDDDQVTGAEFGSNANTVVASHAGGGINDGYETMKVTHTASGLIAYVYGTVLTTGGSGGK